MGIKLVDVQQASRSIKSKLNKTLEPKREIKPCIMVGVDSASTPAVSGRPNYCWVREYGQANSSSGGVFQVLNVTVPFEINKPVLVGPAPKPPYQTQVLGVNTDIATSAQITGIGGGSGGVTGVVAHADTHVLVRGVMATGFATDPVHLTAANLNDCLVTATTPPSMRVQVAKGMYIQSSSGLPRTFPGGQSADPTASIPAAGLARLVNITIDGDTNLIAVTASTAFPCQTPFVDPVPYTGIVAVPVGSSWWAGCTCTQA